MNLNAKFFISLLAIIIILGGIFYIAGKGAEVAAPIDNGEEGTETVSTVPGINVPAGFNLSIFASGLKGARVIELDPRGRILVSQTSEGQITAVWNTDENPAADQSKVLATGLNKPHGMVFNCPIDDRNLPCHLYVAETDALYRYSYDAETPALLGKTKLIDIASSPSDRHFTRSLLFLPSPNEDTLLIAVGSSCDVCNEESPDRAAILSYNIETGTKEVYAKGLRNAVFMTLNPVSGKVFATEMGRDNLGDDIPPDEINIIENKNGQPQNYGWPICYGKNIHDGQFDKNTYIRNPCMEPFETPSYIDLQAHSAPLGLSFIPEEGWPEEWWYDLLVAYHGSWNRSEPTGYKIVRLKMNAQGVYEGTEDFITGWLDEGEKKGRPVDIKVLSGGVAYITDDQSGVVYRLARN